MSLLVVLADHAGEVVSKKEILQHVWGERAVVESVLTRNIAELRRCLGDRIPRRYIETVSKHGYRFIAPVEARKFAQPAIAVLLFANLNADPEYDCFAEGISDALITELAKIRSLRVISRQSVLHLKGSDRPLPAIAAELAVDAVVEGSVTHFGNRMRVTAQLVAVDPERHLWSDTYDVELNDMLRMQANIALAVANSVHATLTPEDVTRLHRIGRTSPEAHIAYLQARYHWARWTEEGFQKSVHYLQEALLHDPSFAPAHELFAMNLGLLGFWGFLPARQVYPDAAAAALKALSFDPSLGQCHTVLGFVRWHLDWDLTRADREFQRAIDLTPSSEFSHMAYAHFLLARGGNSNGAEAEANLATALDPLSLTMNHGMAYFFLFSGRYDDAIRQARRAIELHPGMLHAYYVLGWSELRLGHPSRAVELFEHAVAMSRDVSSLAYLAHAYGRAGDPGRAQAILEELSTTTKNVPEIMFVWIHAGLGENDAAFAALDKCFDERDCRLFWIHLVPAFDPLRSDPRFGRFAERLREATTQSASASS